MYMCVCVYIFVHIYTHTCAYIYIYIYCVLRQQVHHLSMFGKRLQIVCFQDLQMKAFESLFFYIWIKEMKKVPCNSPSAFEYLSGDPQGLSLFVAVSFIYIYLECFVFCFWFGFFCGG